MAVFTGDSRGNRLTGGSGDDTITGNGGNDKLSGLGGNDILSGNAGTDTLSGGDGADTFKDTAAGLNGDTITDFTAADKIIITDANLATFTFSLSGTTLTYSGGTLKFGTALSGTLVATAAPGGGVQLQLSSGSGGSTIVGTSGNDRLTGTSAANQIDALGGDDILIGNAGADTLNGGDGNDWLYSGAESPPFTFPIYGGPLPQLDTGTEGDILNGGAGSDVIFAGYGDKIDGGENGDYGDDLYISFLGAPVGIMLDFHFASQTIGDGTIAGIENVSWVQGSNFGDSINLGGIGNGYSDLAAVFGMGGNDTLIAGYYTGTLDGGGGNDIVDGRNSEYLFAVYGGAGDDTLYAQGLSDGEAYGGDGNDTIYASSTIYGGAGDDTIIVSFGFYPGYVYGDDGNDTITGDNESGDSILGGAGADIISGGAGDDILSGGADADILSGQEGSDTFRDTAAGLNGDTITDFEATDTIIIADADFVTFTFSLTGNTLTFSGGALTFGTSLSGTFVATAAEDGGVVLQLTSDPGSGSTIYGSSGDDLLGGTSGSDRLDALAGNDVLAGLAGADTLIGGYGDDWLYSGDVSPPFSFPNATPGIPPLLDTGNEVDTLIGGVGSDHIFAGYGDNVDGGDGGSFGAPDFLYISFLGAPTGVTVDFRLETQVVGGGTITGIESISWVQGSNFGDSINLAAIADASGWTEFTAVLGMGGDDTLLAGYYTTFLDGGDGNDIVDGRGLGYISSLTGQEIRGGAGDDTIYASTINNANVFGGEGSDTIYSGGTTFGGTGNDTIFVVYSNYSGTINGEDDNDTIVGSDSNDWISGGSGADVISGGSGYDILTSADFVHASTSVSLDDLGLEQDQLSGGDGDDTLSIGFGDSADGGAGSDSLRLSFGGLASGITFDTGSIATGQPFSLGGGTIQNIESLIHVRGTEFADTLNLTQPNSISVAAGGGNDTIVAINGGAYVDGGNGDDLFVSGSAADEFYGGIGIDTVSYANFTNGVTVDLSAWLGGNGDYLNGVENIVGSEFLDTLTGGIVINILTGGGGSDIFRDTAAGLDGDTITDFEVGDKVIITDADIGSFDYSLSGNILTFNGGTLTFGTTLPGNLVATATPGGGVQLQLGSGPVDPTIYGTYGNDILIGTIGDDQIEALDGNDTIAGGGGGDTISGGNGRDWLYSGDETTPYTLPYWNSPFTPPLLDTGNEVDTLNGGAGSDYIFAGYGDFVDGGEGAADGDFLYISFFGAPSGVTVDFRLETQTIGGGIISGIERVSWVQGSNFGDYINATSWADWGEGITPAEFGAVFGMGGNDTLVAGYFTGVLDGGEGNDILDGRGGEYLMGIYGGAGDDTLYADFNTSSLSYGGDGNDTIYSGGTTYGGAGNDTIIVSSSDYPGYFYGEDGDDQIIGAAILGDRLSGGAGADVITGGTGTDNLSGGADADSFRDTTAGLNGDTITDFEAIDKIIITDANLVSFTFSLSGNVLTYSGGSLTFGAALSGTLVATAAEGGGVQLQLSGGSNPPPGGGTITGTSRDDTLSGTSGNDRIEGLAGKDKIFGLAGQDMLVGGMDSDTLDGGAGADLFVYTAVGDSSSRAADRITNLESIDKIDLSLIDAISSTGANDAFSYIGFQGFHNVAGEVRTAQKGGEWLVEADTNGDGQADLSIIVTLSGATSLGLDQFIL